MGIYLGGKKVGPTFFAGKNSENKLPSFVDNSLTEITAKDLAGAKSIKDYAIYSNINLTKLELPNTITSIGEYAIRNTGISTLTIPNSVESIGSYGCALNKNLTDLTVGAKEIGTYAFYYCDKLVNLTLKEGVETINSYAFQYCNSLKKVTIPTSLKTCNTYSFPNSLTDFTLLEGIEHIPDYLAYAGSPNISVTCNFPNTLKSIGRSAFYNRKFTGTLTIPAHIETIGASAFNNNRNSSGHSGPGNFIIYSKDIGGSAFYCSNIGSFNSIYLKDGVETIGGSAFYGYHNIYGNVSNNEPCIPNTVKTIGEKAFSFCKFASCPLVTIPELLEVLNKNTFRELQTMTSFWIPEKFTNIPEYLFYSPKSSTIDNIIYCMGDITNIGSSSFEYMYASLSFPNCTTVPTLTSYSITAARIGNIYVPAELVESFKTATNWSAVATKIIPLEVTNTYTDGINSVIVYNDKRFIATLDGAEYTGTISISTYESTDSDLGYTYHSASIYSSKTGCYMTKVPRPGFNDYMGARIIDNVLTFKLIDTDVVYELLLEE